MSIDTFVLWFLAAIGAMSIAVTLVGIVAVSLWLARGERGRADRMPGVEW